MAAEYNLKKDHLLILKAIAGDLEKYPDQRFWQVLFNLWITEFDNPSNPELSNHLLRDIYNDRDEAIAYRVKESIDKINKENSEIIIKEDDSKIIFL